jgi:hypothetical protein
MAKSGGVRGRFADFRGYAIAISAPRAARKMRRFNIEPPV